MKCPYCDKELDQGRGGCEPQYWWAGCDPCGLYLTAREDGEISKRIDKAREAYRRSIPH